MAYLRRHHGPSGIVYLYIMQSVRKGTKVYPKVCEYLGREDKIDAARLRKAVEYWGVTTKIGKRKNRTVRGKRG
jgi:hypothetical protein